MILFKITLYVFFKLFEFEYFGYIDKFDDFGYIDKFGKIFGYWGMRVESVRLTSLTTR